MRDTAHRRLATKGRQGKALGTRMTSNRMTSNRMHAGAQGRLARHGGGGKDNQERQSFDGRA